MRNLLHRQVRHAVGQLGINLIHRTLGKRCMTQATKKSDLFARLHLYAVAFLIACTSPKVAMAALAVQGVSVSPKQIAANQSSAAVKFSLNENARVFLDIYDARDIRVRRLSTSTDALPAGEHSITWNLKDRQGQPVPPEVYFYTLTAIGNDNETVIYDLTDSTGGKTLVVEDVVYDAKRKVVRYRIDASGRFYLRYGTENGPLLGTLLNGVIRTRGWHEASWDGWNRSHTINLGKHPKLEFYGRGYQLGRNTIIIANSSQHLHRPQWIPNIQEPIARRISKRKPAGKNPYFYRNPARAKDFEISLDIVGNKTGGMPVIAEKTGFRVDIAPQDKMLVERQRFEVSYFIDGQLLYENEISYAPYTWAWDPKTTTPGTHYITALVIAFGGFFGVETAKFIVPQPPQDVLSANKESQ